MTHDTADDTAHDTAHDIDDIRTRLTSFFRAQLAEHPERVAALTARTPLKEWGVLDSLGMARLVGFIRDDLGVTIPFRYLTGRRFGTIDDIAGMVVEAAAG
jgi:acyl carrier protein